MGVVLEDSIFDLTKKQIQNFWDPIGDISAYKREVSERLVRCFDFCNDKYYNCGGFTFSPLNSVQYSIYLYYLANTIYRNKGNFTDCTKIYYLNKILHSVDWYYEISLPDVFGVEHPLNSVMGRASYSNKFFFYQGCTVGGNHNYYPTIGENVIMYSNSSILGKSVIGNNVILGSGTLVKDENIPNNCLVFGQSPNLIIKPQSLETMIEKSSDFWRKS